MAATPGDRPEDAGAVRSRSGCSRDIERRVSRPRGCARRVSEGAAAAGLHQPAQVEPRRSLLDQGLGQRGQGGWIAGSPRVTRSASGTGVASAAGHDRPALGWFGGFCSRCTGLRCVREWHRCLRWHSRWHGCVRGRYWGRGVELGRERWSNGWDGDRRRRCRRSWDRWGCSLSRHVQWRGIERRCGWQRWVERDWPDRPEVPGIPCVSGSS